MNNFVALFIGVFAILFCFIAAVKYSTTATDEGWLPTVLFEDRRIVDFEGANGEKIVPGSPVLVKGMLFSESDSEVILNVAYNVPPNSLVPYSLSIYPKSTGFYPQYIQLEEGSNVARVIVHFKPPSRFIASTRTKHLDIYINEHYGNGAKEVIYKRKIIFDKKWRRARRIVSPYVQSSHFGVSGPNGQAKPARRDF